MLTILSLFEGNDEKSPIVSKIRRAIPLTILKNNLIRNYELYFKYFQGEYSEDCLNLFNEKFEENALNEQSEFIMENGLYTFILVNRLIQIEIEKDNEDEEDQYLESLLADPEISATKKRKNNIFNEFFLFGKHIFMTIMNYCWKVTKKITRKKKRESFIFEKMRNKYSREENKKELLSNILKFYSNFVVHIEIFRDNKLQKIFFPLLPFCKTLPKEIKNNFNEKVNRATSKIKVEELMASAPNFIKIMRHEEKLRLFFNKNKISGLIVNHEKLWKKSAFYINILINFIIIVSYTSKFVPKDATISQRNYIRLNEPYFFEEKEFDQTWTVIIVLGTINLILGSTVVVLFLIKKAPLMIRHVWEGFFETKMNLFFKIWKGFLKVLISFYICLNDMEFLYYIIYILMIMSGLGIHPFFFVFNLTDYLKIDELKNVIQAIWIPRKQLLLSLFLLILVEYYFSLIGYIDFYDQYNQHCNRFWICIFTTFDQTFKVIINQNRVF